jgi:lysophospholipase L1-like esterase
MKPFRIFIFFAAVMLLLSTIAYFMPEHGVEINGTFRLHFLSLSDLFNDRSTPNVENVERLLAVSTVSEDPEADPAAISGMNNANGHSRAVSSHDIRGGVEDSGRISRRPLTDHSGDNPDDRTDPGENLSTPEELPKRSLPAARTGPITAPAKEDRSGPEPVDGERYREEELFEQASTRIRSANVDSLQKTAYPMEFSEQGASMLKPFFETLDDLKGGNILRTRILHFGDSQIENDRMTALVRYRLQKSFGGTGSGLVQAIPLYSGSMAYQQEQEGNWLRYTYFRNRDSTISHNTYGIMAAFASVPAPSVEGWPMIHYSFNLARRAGMCDRVKVFLHSYMEGATLVFNVNDTISDTIRNLPGGYSMADYRHVGIIKDLKIYFDFPEGGRIYGISFESYTGLQMDNIAMRGSGGLIFSRMDREQQQTMMKELSPSLILLQFGGNVVPYMNPRYYRREFEKELAFFKEICPGVPIIVIGPADMSVREKGEFKTYPGLEKIRDALKNATLESGFAFWDLYEAMGGHNSMPSFVHSDPPLASADYVHFNGLGINLVAEMFYNSLLMEYQRYTQTTHP